MCPRRRRYLAAYAGGFVFSALATNWVRVAHPMMYLSWLAFSLVLPLFWVLALDLIRRLDRLGLPLALSVPMVWVALEYMRMHFPTGFPFLKPLGLYQMIGFGWYFLGYTQHANLWLIQIADLGGVYLVSFVVAAINGMIADGALRLGVARRWLKWEPSDQSKLPRLSPVIACSVAVLGLVVGAHAYGTLCSGTPSSPRAARRCNPGECFAGRQDGRRANAHPVVRPGSRRRIPCKSSTRPHRLAGDLLSEFVVRGGSPGRSRWDARDVRAGSGGIEKEFRVCWGTHVLLGLNGLEWDGARVWKYNSALLTDANGAQFARYDKMHLVPFGEYVPLGDALPFMHWFTPYEKDYQCRPGERWTRFPITDRSGRAFTFACLICYEDSDPYLARQYVATDPVNFLVNISNDGWFDGTEEHEQHLAICRFRAVETRRSVVRAVNMGISAVIDPDGRVIELPKKLDEQGQPTIPAQSWSGSKKVEGVVLSAVPIDTRQTLYARLGDWVAAACWVGVLVGVVGTAIRRR